MVRGVDLEVVPGEICALMGVSGAGKSTVLRALAALEPFVGGEVVVGGFVLRPGPLPGESRLRGLRERLGMVFQAHSLFEHLSVLENVALAPIHVLGWDRGRAEGVALEVLAGLGVSGRRDAFPRQLSGGEAQRVAIARAIALDPAFLLMDEPTSALDPARRGALGEALRALAAQGRGLLVATHDVEFALAHADRVAVMAEGAIAEIGSPGDVLESPSHPATRALLQGPDSGGSPPRGPTEPPSRS